MTTFTTLTRKKVNWVAPEAVAATDDFYLNIGSGYKLNIGSGFNLVIQPGARVATTWTPLTRKKVTF